VPNTWCYLLVACDATSVCVCVCVCERQYQLSKTVKYPSWKEGSCWWHNV